MLVEARDCEVYLIINEQFATKNNAKLVGLGGFEPPTSPLSGVRSNQLSYRPEGNRECLFSYLRVTTFSSFAQCKIKSYQEVCFIP